MGQIVENSLFPDNCVHAVTVPVELVLDQVVQHLQQEVDQCVVVGGGEEEPRS